MTERQATKLNFWLLSGASGLSSRCMYAVMLGIIPQDKSQPMDPSDFGRCHTLLEIVPEWRSRIPEMAAISPAWAALTPHWDELTKLYLEELAEDTGFAPRLYKRMKELLDSAYRP